MAWLSWSCKLWWLFQFWGCEYIWRKCYCIGLILHSFRVVYLGYTSKTMWAQTTCNAEIERKCINNNKKRTLKCITKVGIACPKSIHTVRKRAEHSCHLAVDSSLQHKAVTCNLILSPLKRLTVTVAGWLANYAKFNNKKGTLKMYNKSRDSMPKKYTYKMQDSLVPRLFPRTNGKSKRKGRAWENLSCEKRHR